MRGKELYKLAKSVASSASEKRIIIQEEIVKIIKNNINRINLEDFIEGLNHYE